MPLIHRLVRVLLTAAYGLALGSGAPPPGKAAFRVFSDLDGLPQRSIFALARDSRGTLWAGTLAGIGAYDGFRWRMPDLPPSPQAAYVNANAMAALSDGRLWVGTRYQGVLELKDGQWSALGTREGLPSDNVNAILESSERDAAGRPVIWIGTYGKGVARFADGRWTSFPEVGGTGEGRIYCLLERKDPAGRPLLLAGTGDGVWAFQGARWRPLLAGASLPDPRIRALAETQDSDGRSSLWLGTEQRGLLRVKEGRLEKVPLGTLPATGRIRALLVDPSSGGRALIVGDLGGGVARWDQGRWEILGLAEGLPSNQVRSLAMTPGGRSGWVLWIGTEGQGLIRHAGPGWLQVSPPWGKQDPRSQAIWQDPDGTLWVGNMSQGLAAFRQGRWERHDRHTGLPADAIRCLYGTPDGTELYFGTFQGLGQRVEGRWRFHTPRDGLPAGQVRALEGGTTAEGRHQVWVGTSRGLAAWDGRRFWPQPGPSGTPQAVRTLRADGTRLWVGSDRGLACLERGQWIPWPFLERFQEMTVYALLRTHGPRSPNGLWVGTFGSGLFWIPDLDHPERIQQVTRTTTPALPHDIVNGLAEGSDGWVYAATPRGVIRLRPGEGGLEADTFTIEDGLPGQECLEGGLLADRDGRIWVGTGDGLAYLDPRKVGLDRTPRQLVWVGSQVGDRRLAPGASLSHREQGLSFQFRLLSHHREQETRYRTQLVGLQPQPEDWTSSPELRLPTLPPGSYLLKVWARDYAGSVSGPLEFPFRMRPAPWWTWWAFTAYGLLALGAVLAVVRLRLRFMARRNQELEWAVAQATAEVVRQKVELEQLNQELLQLNQEKNRFIGIAAHDLKTPLNAISLVSRGLLSGEIEDCPEALVPWLERVDQAAGNMTRLIGEFLDVNAIESGRMEAKVRSVPLREVVESLLASNRPKAEAKGQRLQVEGLDRPLLVRADPHHLLQVLDNLLSNAIKFSPRDSRVALRIVPAQHEVRLEVADQGPGLTDEDRGQLFQRFGRLSAKPTGGETSTGLGLSIAKHLTEGMGGRIWVDSEPGRGATFSVALPRGEAPDARGRGST